jgi:tetratricopeptide (TPR) repeat protein
VTSSSSTNESSEGFPGGPPAPSRPRRSRRRRSRAGGSRIAALLTGASVAGLSAVLVVAPLAAGGVHRVPMILLISTVVLATILALVALVMQGRFLRMAWVALIPAIFVVIPALQVVPLPHGVRAAIDREGSSLLDDNPFVEGRTVPLTLDPPTTRVHVGKAAAALAVFILAFHIASGLSRRNLLPRIIGATGIAAVTIGLGHRVFGVSKIYGLYAIKRSLLTGPFVNNNHNAEFLEIAAFACLACSFQKSSALNRVGWLTGTLICATGALGTLSRGGALALFAGALLFILQRYLAHDDPQRSRRVFWAWTAFVVGLIITAAAVLGAGQLIERLSPANVSADVRLRLWRDSLRVLAAHPFGIGRGAFERVYPIYRTLETSFSLRFSFVENQPLQLLIESGWLLYAGIVAGVGLLAWTIVRYRRQDLVEAALVSGLFAVIVHSFVDFGLETLGVLLPFVTLLGLVLGRSRFAEASAFKPRHALPVVGLALGGMVFGVASLAHASYDDFDRLIRTAPSTAQRVQLLDRAQKAHPVDYFYVLAAARLEPLRPTAVGVSPRMHTLNRALRLCPGCEAVHMEVARSLWSLSLRSQAIVEWREAARLQPALLWGILSELSKAGARPPEMAAVATFDAKRMVEVATFLVALSRPKDAFTVLDQADAMGAPRLESLLLRGRLQMNTGQNQALRATLAEAHAANIQDPRLVLLDATAAMREDPTRGPDAALSILDTGATRYPQDVPIQRMRVQLVSDYAKWQAAERAIDGLTRALYDTTGSAGEAHTMSARIQGRLGRWTRALGEYRIALADAPADVSLWMELAHAAERAGRDATAREALYEASRLSPSSSEIQADLRRLEDRRAKLTGAPEQPSNPGRDMPR